METEKSGNIQYFSQCSSPITVKKEEENSRRDTKVAYSKSLSCHSKEKEDVIIKLISLVFLRGLKLKEFCVGCNIEGAEMFGDISFNFLDNEEQHKVWLIHVHHPQQKEIMYSLLDSENHLSLLTCLHQMNIVRNNTKFCKNLQNFGTFKNFNFVFYSNASISKKSTFKYSNTCPYSLLHAEKSENIMYSNSYENSGTMLEVLEELEKYKESLEYFNNLKNTSEVDKKLHNLVEQIHTTEIKEKLYIFEQRPTQETLNILSSELKHFQSISSYASLLPNFNLYTEQPKTEKLIELIKKEIFYIQPLNDFGIYIAYQFLMKEIEIWYSSHNYYLNKDSEVWRKFSSFLEDCSKIQKSCMETISKVDIKFFVFSTKNVKSNVMKYKVLSIIANTHDISLSCLKVFQVLEDVAPQKYVWVTFKTLLEWKDDLLLTWISNTFSVLVIEYETDCGENNNIVKELCYILSKHKEKCLIIISPEKNTFISMMKNTIFCDEYCELKDNFRFIDLDDHSQSKVLYRKVFFQGQLIPIGSLIGTNNDLKGSLSASIVSQLMKDTVSVVIGPSLYDSVYNFIPRTLEFLIDIDINILKCSSQTEIFVVSGITIPTLQKIAAREDIEIYLPENTDISESRLFCLVEGNLESQFLTICERFSNKNVHHLVFKKGTLWWKQSKGQTQYLKDYLTMNENARHIWEVIEKSKTNEFKLNTLFDSIEQHSVILGESGVGKSTLLSALQKNTKIVAPTYWLIHLNFNNDIKLIVKTKKEDYDCEIVMQIIYSLLKQEHHASEIEHIIFRHDFEKRGNVIITCEGIESVNTKYLEKVLEFIHALGTMKVKKLWVTSTLNMKTILEKSFRVVSFAIQPLVPDEQMSLLCTLWTKKLENYDSEKMQEFIQSVQSKYGTNKSSLLHIPLFCVMMAEIFVTQVNEYISSNSVHWPENVDAAQIYDQYIQIRRLQNDKSNMDPNITCDRLEEREEFFMNRHMLCALFSLLDIPELRQLNLLDVFENVSKLIDEVKKFGIIQGMVNKKPIFLHKTFAEYFAAMWFSKNIEKCREFLRKKIFAPNFTSILKFFDFFLIRGHELHTAVLKNDHNGVQTLLAYGLDCNSTDKAGRTALHLAIVYSRPKVSTFPLKSMKVASYDYITKLLVDHSINRKVVDNVLQWRPIQYAIELQKWDAIDLLLKEQVDFNDFDCLKEKMKNELFVQEGLRIGSEKGYFNLLECFFCCGINISENLIQTTEGYYNPLHIAAKYGQLKLVRFLLSKRVKISIRDNRGISPLHLAASEGMSDVLVYLLQRGADLFCTDRDGNTPLDFAILKGDLHTIILLIEQYPSNINSQNKFGDTPLHHAVKTGYVNVIEYILMKGAQIDTCNRDGNTALHLAVWLGMVPVIKVLLEYGANTNACNKNGDTPLSQNAAAGNLEIVKLLVEKGADVNKKSNDGNTALHWAARQNKENLVEFLISKGADMNAQNKYGNTPLHRAVEHGCLVTTKFLINAGCNIKLQNNAGNTTVNIRSRSKEVMDCVSFL